MPVWFWSIIAAILVVDGVVLSSAVRRRLAKQGLDFTKLRAVSKLVHERVGDYMRANYGGNLDQLPQALSGLLPIADDVARSNGCTLDRHTLELLVKTSVASHRFATRAQVEAALERVPREAPQQAA